MIQKVNILYKVDRDSGSGVAGIRESDGGISSIH